MNNPRLKHLTLILACSTLLCFTAGAAASDFLMNPQEAAVTRGGGITDNGSLLVVGQLGGGRAKSVIWSIDIGIIAAYFPPPPGINVFWNAAAGYYNVASNWLPNDAVPNNGGINQYNVFIIGADDTVTLNTSPEVSELHVGSPDVTESRLEFNADPSLGFTQSLRVVGESSINATNHGRIRVVSPAAMPRTLELSYVSLQQGPTGVLEAVGATSLARIKLIDSTVIGGTIRSVGPFASIQMRNSDLVDTVIENIEIEAGQPLTVQGNISNEGDLVVPGSSGLLTALKPANINAILQGKSGRVVLTFVHASNGSTIGSDSGVLTNAPGHRIVGQGRIVGPIINNGIIQANSPGASLRVQADVAGTGELIVEEAGKLVIEPGTSTQTTAAADKLIVRAATLPSPASTAEVTGDSVLMVNEIIMQGGDALLRGYTPPILRILGTSAVFVTSDVRFETDAPYALTSDGRMSIGGDFVNHSTDRFNFDAVGTIVLNGATPQNFEMAGEDFGFGNPNSYTNNFSVGTLRIESGATVDFVNAYENLNMGPVCEVLYVQDLVIASGATIRLGDCNIYYQTLINEGGTVQLLGDGLLLSAIAAGDLNGDYVVDHLDAMILASVLVGTDADPNHVAAADMNGDQELDAKDIRVFLNVLFP